MAVLSSCAGHDYTARVRSLAMSAVMDGTDFSDSPGSTLLQLFLDEYERVVAYFRSRISRSDEAKDLAHEVYLRIIGVPEDRVIENARGYLWAVAKSVLCQFLDRSGRMQAVDVDDPVFEAQLAEEPAYDEEIDTESRLTLLREKFPLLPVKCRAVMELKWQHGMSYEDIAARIGISVDTVKKHLKVGLKLLRRHLQVLE